MEWEFRKVLESLEDYKKSIAFKHQIQKGDEGTLNLVIREIELILVNKNEKILSKILALRFVRDIMLIGHEDVIKKVQKLIPHLTKICSHELHSSNLDRGENYFEDHAQYLKALNQQQREEIQSLGSTYFMLSLQSIYHWAKWIPVDSTGQQSIYNKAYHSLVDRGVHFPTNFHYYKQSDTQKFKNIYKMEFFSDSFDSVSSQIQSEYSSRQSQKKDENTNKAKIEKDQVEKIEKKMSKPSTGAKIINSQQYTGQVTKLKTAEQMMEYLNKLKKKGLRKVAALNQMNRKIQQIYEVGTADKSSMKWFQKYLINFGLFSSSFIDYQQFLNRGISQEIQLQQSQHEQIPIERQMKLNHIKLNTVKSETDSQSKQKQEGRAIGSKLQRTGSDLANKNQIDIKNKCNTLTIQLQQKQNEISILRSNFQKEKERIIQQYESRIVLIKNEIKKGHQDKGNTQKQLERENELLRKNIINLENQLANISHNSYDAEIELQRNALLTKVKKLELEKQKLLQLQAKSSKEKQKTGEKQVSQYQKERQLMQQKMRGEIKKLQKQVQSYYNESLLYKEQIINQRTKYQQKIAGILKNGESVELENKQLKDLNFQLKKAIDARQIQLIGLKQQMKKYNENYQLSNKSNYINSNINLKTKVVHSPAKLQQNNIMRGMVDIKIQQQLKYDHYSDLYNQLKPKNKELFLRLCRSSFKKKDILYKENELQIGVISDLMDENKVRFALHFTNTSEKQIENLKIENQQPLSFISSLTYQFDNRYIFCIQPQEQEKINLTVTNNESPFLKERALIQISYEKNGIFNQASIILPFTIIRFLDYYKCKNKAIANNGKFIKQSIAFKYTKKMLPKISAIKNYFDQIEEILPNVLLLLIEKFQMEAHHRETNLLMRVTIDFPADGQIMILDVLALSEKLNEQQRFIFNEFISFLEIAFRK